MYFKRAVLQAGALLKLCTWNLLSLTQQSVFRSASEICVWDRVTQGLGCCHNWIWSHVSSPRILQRVLHETCNEVWLGYKLGTGLWQPKQRAEQRSESISEKYLWMTEILPFPQSSDAYKLFWLSFLNTCPHFSLGGEDQWLFTVTTPTCSSRKWCCLPLVLQGCVPVTFSDEIVLYCIAKKLKYNFKKKKKKG